MGWPRAGGTLCRREFLGALSAVSLGRARDQAIGLSFGTYGHGMLNWEDSLELIARTGYDGVEIALLPGWPTEPRRLSLGDRSRLRGMLADLELDVPAFLENLRIADPVQTAAENRERLLRAMELGGQILPGKAPMIETVLGRKPADWESMRNIMVDEIGDLVRVAAQGETVICFKPHVGSAVNDVQRSLWLVSQVGSRYFRCTFDFSHLWLAGLDLVDAMEALIPVSPYVHLKDAVRENGEHRFVLPGEGHTDYGELCSQLVRLGYSGYVNVEVSAHVHRQPDYQPIDTTLRCYELISTAFDAAGITRP